MGKNYAQKLHEERNGQHDLPPDIKADPDLASAWHSLQLYWLRTEDGYRELVKEKVSEARKRERLRDARLLRQEWRPDVDLLGRDVEGCG